MKTRYSLCLILAASALAFGPSHVLADQAAQRSLFLLGQSGQVATGQQLDAAIVVGGSLVVSGVVHGPAAAVGGDIDILPGAVVEKGVYAIGGTLHIDPTARVEGARTQVASGDFGDVVSKLSAGREASRSTFWLGPVLRLAQVFAVFILALGLAALVPEQVQVVRQTLEARPGKTALAGAIVMLGFVPACVVLAISLFGIALIPVAVFLLIAAFVLGLTAVAATIGYRIPKLTKTKTLIGSTALGMLLLALATLLPVLGGLLWLLTSFYAAGAVLLSRFGTRVPPASGESEPSTPTTSALTAAPHH